jgi:hypothetical protein
MFKIKQYHLGLTKKGCISFFMSAMGMSVPATPRRFAMRVLRVKLADGEVNFFFNLLILAF